jgi:hypothetical protein
MGRDDGCGGKVVQRGGGGALQRTMSEQIKQLKWRTWCLQGAPAINGAHRAPSADDRSGCQYNELVLGHGSHG